MENIMEIKLYSPLTGSFFDAEGDGKRMGSGALYGYMREIQKALEDDWIQQKEAGLAEFIGNPALKGRIISMHPAVDVWQYSLWSVLEVKCRGTLSAEELEALKDEWHGQMTDGWGDAFAQDAIDCGEGGSLYVDYRETGRSGIRTEQEWKGISEGEGMDINQRINKFNAENRPFYIVDHENGEYSLCLALSFLEGEYENFGQEAFNRYAMEIGDPVSENGRWFTHGSGHEWRYVFAKAVEDDPDSKAITYDCEAGGFFCYAKSLPLIEKLGAHFRNICMDGEKFAGLVSAALKEAAEKERMDAEIQDTLRGFLMENPQGSADIMTPDGFLRLAAGQGQKLLDGSLKTVRIGNLEVDAEGLLQQEITHKQQDLFQKGYFQIKTKAPEQMMGQSLSM